MGEAVGTGFTFLFCDSVTFVVSTLSCFTIIIMKRKWHTFICMHAHIPSTSFSSKIFQNTEHDAETTILHATPLVVRQQYQRYTQMRHVIKTYLSSQHVFVAFPTSSSSTMSTSWCVIFFCLAKQRLISGVGSCLESSRRNLCFWMSTKMYQHHDHPTNAHYRQPTARISTCLNVLCQNTRNWSCRHSQFKFLI